MTRMSRLLALLLALPLLLAGLVAPVSGAAPVTRTLVPIGSGYSDVTLQRFARAAAQHDTNRNVAILVLPITYATDPFVISAEERMDNLALADARRGEIELACNAVKRQNQSCHATLAPILVRDDAYLRSNLHLFSADLDGIYILGGDQTIAMQVVADTPTERRMAAAYADGVVVSGNSAGAAVQSLNMIGGYIGDNGPENGLQRGIVDLWRGQPAGHRGLIFGLPKVLLDQHVYERGRLGRLLNAAWESRLIGVGADADTGATIENETRLTDVVGATSVIVIDQKTYASTGRYGGPTNSLAIHHVATHLIPPGGYGYDLARLRPLVNGQPQPAPAIAGRAFDALRLPAGYGPLLLGGDISGDRSGLVARHFVARSGGANARLVVIAAGYAKSADARADAKAYTAAFQPGVIAAVRWFVLDSHANQAAIKAAIDRATGVFVTAPDQSLVLAALRKVPAVVRALRSTWQGGTTLMADNAAAAALGHMMSADPTPTSASLETDASGDFLVDGVNLRAGLGFVAGVAFEPRLLPDRHWGRLYNLVYREHSMLAIGVDVGTAIELTQAGGTVWGTSAVVVLDGRYAGFSVGSNGALGARYVLLDSYVTGDVVTP